MKKMVHRENIIKMLVVGIISAVIGGVIAGYFLLSFRIPIEQKILFHYINNEINEADNFNLFVACKVKSIYKTEKNLLLNYSTQHYVENFDRINKQPNSVRNAIRGNIALMQASNKMMNLLFEQPQKRDEFSPLLIENAKKIIKNLDIYNEQIIEGECEHD